MPPRTGTPSVEGKLTILMVIVPFFEYNASHVGLFIVTTGEIYQFFLGKRKFNGLTLLISTLT